ncbi:MAG TPA: type II toxin-antitoxin system RelE/ParE family toxin [Kiritimatiellia bacterium]|nr:type II toxin-antitoxin system RelE/ParE family toxin [Kiritimatiellia bacterium]
MDTFRIEWKSSAIRELRRLDRSIVPKVLAAVESLASSPYPVGSRKLTGVENAFRIRIGDYRIIYEIHAGRLVLVIVRVRHRKDAYRT